MRRSAKRLVVPIVGALLVPMLNLKRQSLTALHHAADFFPILFVRGLPSQGGEFVLELR